MTVRQEDEDGGVDGDLVNLDSPTGETCPSGGFKSSISELHPVKSSFQFLASCYLHVAWPSCLRWILTGLNWTEATARGLELIKGFHGVLFFCTMT